MSYEPNLGFRDWGLGLRILDMSYELNLGFRV